MIHMPVEEIARRTNKFGGWWETECECGAINGEIETMQMVGRDDYIHLNGCGKRIIRHEWFSREQSGIDDPEEIMG